MKAMQVNKQQSLQDVLGEKNHPRGETGVLPLAVLKMSAGCCEHWLSSKIASEVGQCETCIQIHLEPFSGHANFSGQMTWRSNAFISHSVTRVDAELNLSFPLFRSQLSTKPLLFQESPHSLHPHPAGGAGERVPF